MVEFLTYLDANAVVKVELCPTLPLLNLQDVRDTVQSVSCSDSAIIVHLSDPLSFEVALSVWSEIDSFVILTDHIGCHNEGEHGVWK